MAGFGVDVVWGEETDLTGRFCRLPHPAAVVGLLLALCWFWLVRTIALLLSSLWCLSGPDRGLRNSLARIFEHRRERQYLPRWLFFAPQTLQVHVGAHALGFFVFSGIRSWRWPWKPFRTTWPLYGRATRRWKLSTVASPAAPWPTCMNSSSALGPGKPRPPPSGSDSFGG